MAASDDGASFDCVATLLPPWNTYVTSSQSPALTATLLPTVYYTNGLKLKMFSGATDRVAVEQGNVGPATWINVEPNFDNPGGYGDNYVTRISGWFIPPSNDNYTFFLACDDDSDLFLSTDETMANKRLIAQETVWSGMDQWLTNGAGGSVWSQKRSDTWSPDGGVTKPYAGGIPLTGGQPYYIENVHHQGGGGDNFAATYQTATMMANPNWALNFTNGTPSLLQATNNNIMLATWPATYLNFTLSPTNTKAAEGLHGYFFGTAVSDSEFPAQYQWLRVGVPIAGATGSSYTTPITTPADNQAQFQLVASVEGGISKTSAPAILTVISSVFEPGWATMDFWGVMDLAGQTDVDGGYGGYKQTVETGNPVAPSFTMGVPAFEAGINNENGGNYINRVSGFFVPPTTGNYVFFVNSDDDSDLFISTDKTPANKYMIAQETSYANVNEWLGDGGVNNNPTANPPTVAPASTSQKRSDQWTNSTSLNLPPYAAGIPLNAGQRYYMEVVHHEGGGGDNVEVTAKTIGAPDPVNYSATVLVGNLIGSPFPRCSYVSFAQQPANVTVPAGGTVKVSVQAGPTDAQIPAGTTGLFSASVGQYALYQWQYNGADIPGATASSLVFGPVTSQDNGVQLVCKMRALGLSDNSLQPIWSNSQPATVTVAGNLVYEPGLALHEYYNYSADDGRVAIENGTAGNPAWAMTSTAFEVDTNSTEVADSFCDQLVGFFVPPEDGNYVFFCNSDDDADLFLSTDSLSVNKRLIAQETGWAPALNWGTSGGTAGQHRSDTFVDPATGLTPYALGIPLTNGVKYFMQCVHHQGGGGTETCVTYELTTDPNYPNAPANGTVSAIRGSELGTYVPQCHVTVTENPQSVAVNSYASATFTTGAASDSIVAVGSEGDWRAFLNNYPIFFQWYKNGTPVAGATTSALTMPQVLPSDNNTTVYCDMRALGYGDNFGNALWTNSTTAVLTVITGAPPQLLYSAIYTNNTGGNPMMYVTLNFSKPMDPVALSNPLNYVLGGGLSIQSITVNSNTYENVILTVTGTPSYPFTVTINNVSGLGGGLALVGNTTNLNRILLTDADIGTPPDDPAIPGEMYPTGTNAFNIQCEGSDIYGNADGFNFAYEMKTGDFDVVVRQKDTTHTSNWSKGGLMVRETLDADSREWCIVNDPLSSDGIMAPDGSGYGANVIECNTRNSTGGGTAGWDFVARGTPPAYPNAWVRLTRVGDLLSAYWSTNNAASWTLAATNDPTTVGDMIALPAEVFVGICCTAHNNDPAGTPPSQLKYMAYMDFDSYNSEYVYVPPITINPPQRVGNNIVMTWTPAVGRLLASPALTGPLVDWQQVGSGGSASILITGTAQFFRVVNP